MRRASWYRTVQAIEGKPGAVIQLAGKEVINFASNDYLGLAGDDRLIQSSVAATQEFGTGSTGSRLLSGHRELHRKLECAIASLKQTEDALVFSSGYLANLGAISAIVGKRDLILADTYNHSCLKNGAILSGARAIDYPHKDIEVLRNQLFQQRSNFRRCLIITDSVFSMDGDLCPLPQLSNLAEEFNCMLLVDEAHATGVFGATGAGCAEHFSIANSKLIQVGTLSKAIGSLGGFVAGSKLLIDFLRNRAASWIYTTALSPADTAAAISAIALINSEPQRRQQLWDNVAYLKQQLPLPIIDSQSQIVCCQYPNAKAALQASFQLKNAGIFAPAIRPPTVPTSRIRFSVMATHELEHIDKAIAALTKILL
jgi:8-amino-7-oxononanoate synthase